MSVIKNNTYRRLIEGTNGNDSIVNGDYWNNGGYLSTILSGDGNDTIENWGSNVSINGGAGRDYIYNKTVVINGGSIEYAHNVSIEGGKGNDTHHNIGTGIVYIYNNGDGNDLIRAFNADDTLLVASGTWSTKKSGSDIIVTVGEDKITLEGAKTLSKVNIVSSKKDVHPITFINNYKTDTLITGTSYNDSIYNYKVSSVTIDGAAGNDTIENSGGSDVSINAGAGNDVIKNRLPTWASGRVDTSFLSCKNVTLNGGSGNDYIFNNIKKVTIIGGKGNDYILNWGGNTGDVGGLGASVSINGGSGNDYIENYGRSVTIVGGTGNDTIENHEDNVTISSGAGNDILLGGSNHDSLNGGSGDDTLNGGDDNDILLGGTGNDSLSGGDGKDTLNGGDDNDKLFGGAGNDCIKGGTGKDTLWGGKGNDTLWGDDGADKFIYAKGDGKDVIFGFDSKDTLTLDHVTFKKSMASYSKSQGALTLNISGGSITLKDLNTTTSIHINNDSYKISGTKLVKN